MDAAGLGRYENADRRASVVGDERRSPPTASSMGAATRSDPAGRVVSRLVGSSRESYRGAPLPALVTQTEPIPAASFNGVNPTGAKRRTRRRAIDHRHLSRRPPATPTARHRAAEGRWARRAPRRTATSPRRQVDTADAVDVVEGHPDLVVCDRRCRRASRASAAACRRSGSRCRSARGSPALATHPVHVSSPTTSSRPDGAVERAARDGMPLRRLPERGRDRRVRPCRHPAG